MAVEEGLLQRNPALPIKVKVPETRQSVLSPTEISILLREAKAASHRFYSVWVMALLTGMRSGELYALRWTDIDMENGMVHVNQSWNSKSGFGPTKSAKVRVVPISSELKRLFMDLKADGRNKDFVLPHHEEWTRGEQAKVLRDFCEAIGITSVKFHDLRATFITQLLRNGESLAKVMAMVGHSELKTTQGYLRLAGHDVIGGTEKLKIELPQEEEANVVPLFGSNP